MLHLCDVAVHIICATLASHAQRPRNERGFQDMYGLAAFHFVPTQSINGDGKLRFLSVLSIASMILQS